MAKYRDKKTGRYVSAATWKRSKAHGGSRYVRERVYPNARKGPSSAPTPKRPTRSRRSQEQTYEWIVSFKYKRRRAFDVIVTAQTEEQAEDLAVKFLYSDRNGRRVIESGMKGWDMRIARGHRTTKPEGKAEYRNKRR